MRRLAPFVMVAALAAAGCTVGPAYRRPAVAPPQQWPGEPARGVSAGAPVMDEWWKSFHDAQLESLVARAVQANLDMKIAAARVQEARASRRVARSGLAPQVNAGASVSRERQAIFGLPFGSLAYESNLYQGELDMSWEADVFGRIRSQVRGASADLAAQENDRRDVLLTLLGDVAANYAQLRGYQLRLTIAARNIAIEQDTLDLTRALTAAGQATDRDVAQAESQLEATRATVPQLETLREQAVHRLGVLLGSEPASLAAELSQTAPLPAAPGDVPVGLPSELLERRPDIRRSEAQLVAATARVGEAKAEFFPKFSLTGTGGRESTQLHLLALGLGNVFSFGPSISVPVFTAGRIRANVALQEARVEEAEATYRSTVLTALEETENALVGYSNEQDRRDRLEQVTRADRTALDLAQVQYKAGLADFLTVLDAERTLSQNEDQLAQSQTAIATSLVSLYKALGGGWPAFPATK
jgi:multidrug efflux system outer membrane protein